MLRNVKNINKLNPEAFARASALVTVAVDIGGYLWHGILRQPSMMNTIYPGFWNNWTLMLIGLAGTAVAAYLLGYLFAWAYNKQKRKMR